MSAENSNLDEKLDEKFIVRGTIEYKYILDLEERCKILDLYEDMTGINTFLHVKNSLLQDSPKDEVKTS